MSEPITMEDAHKGIDEFDELVEDVQKHLSGRLEKIQKRLNSIEEMLSEAQRGDRGKGKGFGKAKKITKGAMAAVAKSAVDVELLASQEEAVGDIKLEAAGLLDRIKKAAKSKDAITEDEGQKIAELVAKIKDEFLQKVENLEKRIDVINDGINLYEKTAGKEKTKKPIAESKAEPINDIDKAYAFICEMYEDLSKRFDILEKKLDKIERKIEKELPGISFKNSSRIKKSMIGKVIDGFKGLFKKDPQFAEVAHKIENQASERAEEMDIGYEGDEPRIYKAKRERFKFGKFDANVLLPAIEDRTDDEFKENLYSKYSDTDKADTEYEMQNKRIDKLLEKGYIEKVDGRYRITDKGKEAAREVNKEFEFTSYDVNVVFDYINRNNGQLSLEMLKEELEKDYKTKEEIDKQYKYLQKRIKSNLENGYLAKNSEGNYVITDKGKRAAAKLKLKKDKENSIAL
ncbi:winged helix-turn-helix domain-containing protein [Lutispora thermophila]|uniref:Winged helix-turn-helix n=1 Tax=Lutispora thermophila DSM 19022 TaxID=1122184 RepID=A0A1M6IPF6_9FIRM|nr:winged helix-turn-helix domain-containing protein [Lutispora thermophila]SHJ36298.1 Winged helix-turn-helix [Lutispora thermophila DSM 19022]